MGSRNPASEGIQFTRADYLKRVCTHRQYYAQYVTEPIKLLVKSSLYESLRRSEDPETFNDIPLRDWDHVGASLYLQKADIKAKMEQAGDFWSPAGVVCILKEAARQVYDAHTAQVEDNGLSAQPTVYLFECREIMHGSELHEDWSVESRNLYDEVSSIVLEQDIREIVCLSNEGKKLQRVVSPKEPWVVPLENDLDAFYLIASTMVDYGYSISPSVAYIESKSDGEQVYNMMAFLLNYLSEDSEEKD